MEKTVKDVRVGDQAFVTDGGEEFGAVREVRHDALVLYVENSGEFVVPLDAISAVHHQKVIFDRAKLTGPLLKAIGHAHDNERPGL